MAKSASTPPKNSLPLATRQMGTHLELLRNHLRHVSSSTSGRVTRKRKVGQGVINIEVSVGGRVSVIMLVRENNGTPDYKEYVASLDGKGVPYLKGWSWTGSGRKAKHTALTEAYALKKVRHALNKYFPGYTRQREQWTPPLRPINERQLPE